MKFKSDIDIDFGDRDKALSLLKHIPAGIIRDGKLTKHNTGVYVSDIPQDPFTGIASLDYHDAEERGYVKLDFLNVSLYNQIKDEAHLVELMNTGPAWDKLYDREFCSQLIHINNHYDTLIAMPEAVNSIPRMAMFLAVIRPAKRHLIGKTWKEVAETVWEKPTDGSYAFKKSHAISYSHLVCVNMNLLTNLANQGN
ncbi:MAG TPA: hypothetical protein VFM18_17180 [Methanosarcina sp.]|nr:hypothetical protein [Methanosarcina sp.]